MLCMYVMNYAAEKSTMCELVLKTPFTCIVDLLQNYEERLLYILVIYARGEYQLFFYFTKSPPVQGVPKKAETHLDL